MKSLSIKSLSSKGQSLRLMDCFSPNASMNSILYSRCLLYIVLLISVVNLFYIVNLNQIHSLVIFFLVGFISSFFIKNMIVILLFATFVSLFFQSTQYTVIRRENFENEKVEEKIEVTPAPIKEPNIDENDDSTNEDEVDLTSAQIDYDTPTVTKAAKLKKDMKDYFDVQQKLLDVLEKAEPLQKEAMAIKERFNEKAKKAK
jgi:hypothetical protein